jgi:tRNA 5-methylaminomethyl-2-thiouridine biosynthesis bifunctional protein
VIPFIPLTPPQFEFDRSVLYSPLYGDVYASAEGAFAQAAHVFLGGNDLPQRWRDRRDFVIVETGFGAGVNFLTAWDAWRNVAAPARLHYVAVEKHPFSRHDLRRVLARWPECHALASQLLERYPLPLPGFHRVSLDSGRVLLTMVFGDAEHALPELEARADAFFLDGFAPAKNPHMWSAALFAQIARLAAPDATAATYTVASSVRIGLEHAGFAVRKTRGFGNKREMLCARFKAASAARRQLGLPRSAVIIGAGLAGSACAASLHARGVEVEVIERHSHAAAEASGNPAGLVMPAFSLDWNLPTRLTVCAFLHALRGLQPLQGEGWFNTGVLQLARDDEHLERHQRIVERYALPHELVQLVSEEEGAALIGTRVAGPGWWLPSAGWANPVRVCESALAHARRSFGHHAIRVKRTGDDLWEVLDERGATLSRAPLVILANAHGASELLDGLMPALGVTRGQVSLLPQPRSAILRAPVCRDGYITPAIDGMHCIGASYEAGSHDLSGRLEDHLGNLQRLERLVPGYARGIDARTLTGRAALRAVAPDRMPIAGPCSNYGPGLYTCIGLASRGITYAPLLAEMLASMIAGEPFPLERSLAARLAPQRFSPAV